MLYNINMEFMQAFNPLYAVPIVAVIFCALIVFTFGFKSPIQPPSFEGLEEDKKSGKKRKTKEIHKQSKLVTNGKSNRTAISKGKVQETSRKKEIADNSVMNEIPKINKSTLVNKKAAKKAKPKNERPQEKKKENVIADELNDDGWVHLVSKKGKKNRKKEDNAAPEVQSNINLSPTKKAADTNGGNEVDKVPLNYAEALNGSKKEMLIDKLLKKKSEKDTYVSSRETPVKLDITVEVKPDENYFESELKQYANIPKVSEDASKSKTKKKKLGTASTVVEAISVFAPSSVQIEPVSIIRDAPLPPPKIPEPIVDNVPFGMSDDSKINVVFDELAGLYPDAKDKKKKKVRRDN